jgi:hypothetical protein
VVDTDRPADDYPLRTDIEALLQASDSAKSAMMQAFEGIAQSVGDALLKAPWYRASEWLQEMLDGAPGAFNGAFKEWRMLYAGAMAQREAALKKRDLAKNRRETEQADQELRFVRPIVIWICSETGVTATKKGTSTHTDTLAAKPLYPGITFRACRSAHC